jgi:hypothetical protein
LVDSEDGMLVSELLQFFKRPVMHVTPLDTLGDVMALFKSGRSHIAVVTNNRTDIHKRRRGDSEEEEDVDALDARVDGLDDGTEEEEEEDEEGKEEEDSTSTDGLGTDESGSESDANGSNVATSEDEGFSDVEAGADGGNKSKASKKRLKKNLQQQQRRQQQPGIRHQLSVAERTVRAMKVRTLCRRLRFALD